MRCRASLPFAASVEHGGCCGIGEKADELAVAKGTTDDLTQRRGDRGTVGTRCDRQTRAQRTGYRGKTATATDTRGTTEGIGWLPARKNHRIALSHERKAIASGLQEGEVRTTRGGVEHGECEFVAAICRLVNHAVIAAREVYRLEDHDVDVELYLAARFRGARCTLTSIAFNGSAGSTPKCAMPSTNS